MRFAASLLFVACVSVAPVGAAFAAAAGQDHPSAAAEQAPLTMEGRFDVKSAFTPDYVTCMNSGDARSQVTAALINCKTDELSRQDDKLNRQYKALMGSLKDKEDRARLTALEAKWIKARDAMCDSESADAGEGTLSTVVLVDCQMRLTTKRTLELTLMSSTGF